MHILTSNNPKNQILQDLKYILVQPAKNLKTAKFQGGQEYTKLALEKLWALLDFQYYQQKIISFFISIQ